jgi:2-polyprenyl-6-methoxyphenol hydroxylase-like FAD-dependent oxidoreductase
VHHNRVVFIGDASHAATPNLAQGGCQAIEDAVCLAVCLRQSAGDVAAAYRAFQRQRKKKVSFVVNTSWRFGRGAHSPNRLVYNLARAALERTPGFLLARQEHFLSDVDYLKDDGGGGGVGGCRLDLARCGTAHHFPPEHREDLERAPYERFPIPSFG